MAILPKPIYIFKAISMKILQSCLTELEQVILKYTRSHKKNQIAKVILNIKNLNIKNLKYKKD